MSGVAWTSLDRHILKGCICGTLVVLTRCLVDEGIITLRQKRNETTYSSVYHPFFTADSLSLVLLAPAWRLAFDVIGRIQVLATFPQHPFLVMYHGRFSRPP